MLDRLKNILTIQRQKWPACWSLITEEKDRELLICFELPRFNTEKHEKVEWMGYKIKVEANTDCQRQ